MSKQKGLEKAETFHELAWAYKDTNFQKAVYYGEEALKIAESLMSQNDICAYGNTLGILYLIRNRLEEAQIYFLKSLSAAEILGDKKRMAQVFSNLGNIYQKQLNYNKALDYYIQSYEMKKEIKDEKTYVPSLINIAGTHFELKNVDKALEYFLQAEKEAVKFNDKHSMGIILGNLGIIYREKDDFTKAIEYYQKSLEIKKAQNAYDGIAATELNLGSLYLKTNVLDSADKYLNLSLEKALVIENYDRINLAYWNLSDLNHKKGNYKLSHEYAILAYRTKDSIYAKNSSKALAELQTQFETEKKQKQIELLTKEAQYNELEKEKSRKELELLNREKLLSDYEKEAKVKEIDLLTQQNLYKQIESENKSKEIELLNKERTIKETELERQKTVRNLFIVGFVSILLITFFIYNRYQIKQKSNKKLASQNTEIKKQRDEIEKQKQIVEEQNKGITDSIRYAKRIQAAILPSQSIIKQCLPDSFVLYIPKDIVAGDFYWLYKHESMTYIAAADCTGHGVPGAMVSVVCNNALNRSVKEYGLADPGKILDKTCEIVTQEFAKSGEDVKDGMDISLCALHGTTLNWSGANNPLWIIADENRADLLDSQADLAGFKNLLGLGGKTLYEIKPNKQPIGKVDNPQPFTTHTIELQEGDAIYIFTDGYQDQFGGDKGKKFKASQLKELLLSIQDKTMDEQKELLDKAFEDWRGNLEQIDDVCIIGVRI
ncbi:MAG: tetratricopeptide repeat protein [Flavobacteriales bacterium]